LVQDRGSLKALTMAAKSYTESWSHDDASEGKI